MSTPRTPRTKRTVKKPSELERAENETTLTFNLPKEMKRDLQRRAQLSVETPVARLVRLAIRYHDARGWRDIPQVYQGDLPEEDTTS